VRRWRRPLLQHGEKLEKSQTDEGLQVFGTDRGFNAVNGLLLDVPWMRVPLLFGGTGMLFAVLMLGSVLMVQLRALYARGLPTEALAR